MSDYHYTECGLRNVYIRGLTTFQDDEGDQVVCIKYVNLLHTTIVAGIVNHAKGISGEELRFLRTEMGLTQAELGNLIHCDKQTIGRWERGEVEISQTSEIVIRMLAIDHLKNTVTGPEKDYLLASLDVAEISKRTVPTAETQPITLAASDEGYDLIAA